jgi:hemolysin activation/secretion protein
MSVLVLAQWLLGQQAIAQPLAPIPGEASQLPPAPIAPHAIPDIRIDRPDVAQSGGPLGASVLITSLSIAGATRFSQTQLIAAAQFKPGRSVTLSDLRRMAALISTYYNAHGYIVAQAYVPAQEVKGGAVTIVVIEGRYGDVKLKNHSELRSPVAQNLLTGLNSGDPVTAAPLERRLLLLSDLPGVQVRSTLSPGAAVGTSDLTVALTPGPKISGDLEVDNYGNPYIGAYQGGGTVNLNEPFGIGDVASLRLLTAGSGMQYARASYQAQAGAATVGAAYAYFHYQLGGKFSDLHASGSEQIASLYASYPLIRSYNNNLQLQADVDHRILQDRIGLTSTDTDRLANVVTLGLSGDHQDRFHGGGSDVYSVYISGGDLDIQSPLARAVDAASAKTDGGYGKLRFSLDRLQTIGGPFSLYGLVRGQVASKNLDISEKMELGGAYGVRAYPEGESYGDEGYIATLEGRLRLPPPPPWLPGRFQLIGFFDTGWVRLDENPWISGSNNVTRSGAGVGLNWTVDNSFVARTAYAYPLGTGRATSSPDGSGQFWFELVKFF